MRMLIILFWILKMHKFTTVLAMLCQFLLCMIAFGNCALLLQIFLNNAPSLFDLNVITLFFRSFILVLWQLLLFLPLLLYYASKHVDFKIKQLIHLSFLYILPRTLRFLKHELAYFLALLHILLRRRLNLGKWSQFLVIFNYASTLVNLEFITFFFTGFIVWYHDLLLLLLWLLR